MRVRLENSDRVFDFAGEPLGQGGEAAIFALPDDPKQVAKVYHKPAAEHADKLAAMIANPPADPMVGSGHASIAWPTARLLADGGERVVGYLMPRVDQVRLIQEFYNPRARMKLCPLFHFGYLLRTARNLAAAVRALHERGYVIGDVNESNILVNTQALVTLVDTDSFQVAAAEQTFRCRVGKPEFTPPELQGARFADIDRSADHDSFGLAVLLFQLLMQGTHPFTGIYTGANEPPPVPKRIQAGHWPYAKSRHVPYQPSPHAPPLEMLPPLLRHLFTACFEEGHSDPSRRPRALAWQKALYDAEKELKSCSVNSQHQYHQALDACPWCVLTKQHGRDPFPSADDLKAARQTMGARPSTALTAIKQIPLPPAGTSAPPPSPNLPAKDKVAPRASNKVLLLVAVIVVAVLATVTAAAAGIAVMAGYILVGDDTPRPSLAQLPAEEPEPTPSEVLHPAPPDHPAGPPMPSELEIMGPPAPDPAIKRTVAVKRERPAILGPDEFQVDYLRGAFRSYVFTVRGKRLHVMMLRPGGGFEGGPRPAPAPGQRFRIPNLLDGRGLPPPQDDIPLLPGEAGVETMWMPADQVMNVPGGRPAETIVPVRLVVIQAAFPYRKQVEAFRQALKPASLDALWNDGDFAFHGVHVQRRTLLSGGKTAEWSDLDVTDSLRFALALGHVDEDIQLIDQGITWDRNRLLTPRPRLARDQQYPATRLKTILAAQAAMQKALDTGKRPPPAVNRPDDGSDPFGFTASAEPGIGQPFEGPGPRGMAPTAPPGPKAAGQDPIIPEHCLVRFLDPTVQPGQTYEYRMRVAMYDPSGPRPTAPAPPVGPMGPMGPGTPPPAPTEVKPPEAVAPLVGDWVVVGPTVAVPDELAFYAVEQDARKSAAALVKPDQVWMQAHRWLDYAALNRLAPRESLAPTADWAIADQFLVGRGEWIGRWEDVPLAAWSSRQEAFVLAAPIEPKKKPAPRRTVPKVPIDFTTHHLLVDFDGGKFSLATKRDGKEVRIRDEAATELLILTPDGRLIVRSAARDATDPERVERFQAWQTRLRSARDIGDRDMMNPFGPRGQP